MKTQFKKLSNWLLPVLLLFGMQAFGALTLTTSLTPVCHANDGAVTVTETGGIGSSYTYELSQVSPYYSYITSHGSPTFTGLTPGVYNIVAYSSQDSSSITFTIATTVNATAVITNTACPANNGSIVNTVSGGATPYTYRWNNGATTSGLTGLAGNVYTLSVTDANGCQLVQYDTVFSTSSLTATIANTGAVCNQTLTATAGNGTAPFTYSWSTGGTTAAINNLYAGQNTYDVVITDAHGCTAVAYATATLTSLFIDSNNLTGITYPSCISTTGSISVTMTNGTPPFSYNWSNGETGGTATSLTQGTYILTVTDANGCTATRSYNLPYQSIINPGIVTSTNPPNCSQATGAISTNATETSGPGIFTYLWSNGATTTNISNLLPGTYTVTVSDNQGCSASQSITLTGVPTFTVSITKTPTSCNSSLPTGTATAIVSGPGTAPFNYTWYVGYGGVVSGTTQTISNLPYGAVLLVEVSDANGCGPVYIGDSSGVTYDPACYDHITGYAYNDANANCQHDAGETGAVLATVVASPANGVGQTFYATPDTTGFYDLLVFPGTYTVSVSLNNSSSCTISSCTILYADTFTTTGQIKTGQNFAISSGPATFDLGVHMGYQGSAPGQNRQYWVYYYNWGQTAVANGVLTFVHDPNITLINTTPAYTSYDAASHTITWNIVNNLAPMSWLDQSHQVVMEFNIPSNVTLGTELTAQASISPVANDCNPANNTQYLTDLVSASHDPNEKEVSPAGNLSDADTVLTYTIRFQNTGNAPATLVVISDTLSPNVDPATVQGGASSSPYTYKLTGNGILTFTFEPIYLIDSATSADSSKGFVMYTVHTKKNLALGAEVKNTAYIYFDANPAVVTNTTSNLRSNFPTAIKDITGSAISSQVLPNPSSDKARIAFEGTTGVIDLKITDALGNVIISNTSETPYYTLNAEKLAAGIYFYAAKDAAGNRTSGKISIVH